MHTQLTGPSVHEKIKEFYKFFPDKVECLPSDESGLERGII